MRAATASARRAPFLEHCAHALDCLRGGPLDAAQVPAGEGHEPHRRLGGHRGVPQGLLEQAHLAEEVARPEIGHMLAAARDLGRPLLDCHELVREVALAHEHLARLDEDLLCEGRDLCELLVPHLLEQRDRLQPRGIQRSVPPGSRSARPYPTGASTRTITLGTDMFARFASSLLLGRLREGRLEIVGDGRRRGFGPPDAPLAATVRVHDPSFWRALLGGSRRLAEAYGSGVWDTDDLVTLVRIGAREMPRLDRWRRPLAPLRNLFSRIPRNTRSGARRHVAA